MPFPHKRFLQFGLLSKSYVYISFVSLFLKILMCQKKELHLFSDAKDDITLYLLASAIVCLIITIIVKVKQLYLLISLKAKL
jgi:hypothetical protein